MVKKTRMIEVVKTRFYDKSYIPEVREFRHRAVSELSFFIGTVAIRNDVSNIQVEVLYHRYNVLFFGEGIIMAKEKKEKARREIHAPGIVALDAKKIHGMKFQEKFDFAFRKILVMGGIAVTTQSLPHL